jgi:hypothetical protein
MPGQARNAERPGKLQANGLTKLLEAIFPVMPNTKHIDFRFVYQIASQIVPDHQISH